MSSSLPAEFRERLAAILPSENFEKILATFDAKDAVSMRVNPLKMSRDAVLAHLQNEGVKLRTVGWMKEAVIVESSPTPPGDWPLVREGVLYRQSLSSMLPPLVLGPRPGERVLDLCAAPGSKTTQIAGMMNNEGTLVAVEAVRGRFYKLKSVCALLGARVSCKCLDARKFRSPELFDRVLVDAPCSSEGRFRTHDADTFHYWSMRKIKEMVRKQRGLLLSAARLLKPGGVLVYSTCTFAPEENEGVIDWLLRKTGGTIELEGIVLDGIPAYPALTVWNEKSFDPQVRRCLRVLPDGIMEGFFVARLRRTV